MRCETIGLVVLLTAGGLLGVSPSAAASKDVRTASAGLYLPEVVVTSSLLLCTDVDDPASCTTLAPIVEQRALRSLEVVIEYVSGEAPGVIATAGTPLPAAAGRVCRQKTGAVARLVLSKSHRTARLSVRVNGVPVRGPVVLGRSKSSGPDDSAFAPGICY